MKTEKKTHDIKNGIVLCNGHLCDFDGQKAIELTRKDIEFYIECVIAYYNPRDKFEAEALKKLSVLNE